MKKRIVEAAICAVFVVVMLCSSVNAQGTASSQELITIEAESK